MTTRTAPDQGDPAFRDVHEACPACGCTAASATHAINAALDHDDLDRAIDAGLLGDVECDACSPACRARRHGSRDARLAALAARDRFRAREARLSRRAQERAERRDANATLSTALPPAAAAALARARARAARRP
jgi:hypothetical protein